MEKAFVKYKIINLIYCFSETAIYALVDHVGMQDTSMHANTKVFPQPFSSLTAIKFPLQRFAVYHMCYQCEELSLYLPVQVRSGQARKSIHEMCY